MPSFHPRVRALVVGVAAVALVAVGVGGTVAASNPTTLYACFDVYGNVVQGPPSIPLESFKVELIGPDVFVRRKV